MARMSGRQFDRNLQRRYRQRFGRAPQPPAGDVAAPLEDRQAEIAELAESVADEYCPDGRVEPAAIATAKRITFSFGQYGDAFDGMLEYEAGRFHIYGNLVRLGQPDGPRARFTLAHELGHYFIDEHRNALSAGSAPAHGSLAEYESPGEAEQQADHFAANLLLPRRRFLSSAKASAPGLGGVLELAQRWGVSVTAAAIRCAAADVRPCAVVKWDRRGYAWKHLSTATFQAYFRTTFESPDALAAGSPTRRALAGEPAPEGGFFHAATVASAWFPGVEVGQWRDIIFFEDAISLGRFGALTFLYPQGGKY